MQSKNGHQRTAYSMVAKEFPVESVTGASENQRQGIKYAIFERQGIKYAIFERLVSGGPVIHSSHWWH